MNKMENRKSEAEKRNGTVLGTEAYTDARTPNWSMEEQIGGTTRESKPMPNVGRETPQGAVPTDARTPTGVSGD